MITGFAWTDQAVAELKNLVESGHSFSAIAEMLNQKFPKQGTATRNSCIGKAHRLHLVSATVRKQRPAPHTRPAAPRRRMVNVKPQQPAEKTELAKMHMADFADALAQEAAPIILKTEQPARPEPEAAPPTAPDPLGPEGGIGFFDMRESLCKFPTSPVSKPGEKSFDKFRACGASAPLGRPYCDHHHSVAYQPSQKRQRREQREEAHRSGFRLPPQWMNA